MHLQHFLDRADHGLQHHIAEKPPNLLAVDLHAQMVLWWQAFPPLRLFYCKVYIFTYMYAWLAFGLSLLC